MNEYRIALPRRVKINEKTPSLIITNDAPATGTTEDYKEQAAKLVAAMVETLPLSLVGEIYQELGTYR